MSYLAQWELTKQYKPLKCIRFCSLHLTLKRSNWWRRASLSSYQRRMRKRWRHLFKNIIWAKIQTKLSFTCTELHLSFLRLLTFSNFGWRLTRKFKLSTKAKTIISNPQFNQKYKTLTISQIKCKSRHLIKKNQKSRITNLCPISKKYHKLSKLIDSKF
jgi:hypothetical protein